MSAGPQLSSFLRPMSKLPPVGGACQWGCTKTVPVLDSSIPERADSVGHRTGKGSSWTDRRMVEVGAWNRRISSERAPRMRACNSGSASARPGGKELVLVAESERSIRQPDQVEVEVVPEEDRRIRGGVKPSRIGHVRVPPLEVVLWREDRERVERVPRREPLQELVSRAERKPSQLDRPVGPGRLDEKP